MFTAATFSLRCTTFDVPGIGSITGLRFKSQASATCAGVAPWRVAIVSSSAPGLREIAGGERKPRDEADAVALAVIEHALLRAVGQVVAVLHGGDLEQLAGGFDVGNRDFAQPGVADDALRR